MEKFSRNDIAMLFFRYYLEDQIVNGNLWLRLLFTFFSFVSSMRKIQGKQNILYGVQ